MNSEAKTFVRSTRRRATITRHRAISLRSRSRSSNSNSNSSIQLQNDDMKRLLLLLVPLVLADPAIAFDGDWYDKEERPELSTDQSETLAKYSEFHQSCMEIQMTMWGEVAELMEDLATAHCYCEYTKLEDLESITWADKNAAEICLLYTSPSPRDKRQSRMPSSA